MRRLTASNGRWTQQGGMLVETAVAILIFSMVGTAVLSGLSTGAIASRTIERQANMENIARNQIEYTLSQPYIDPNVPPAACPAKPTLVLPTGYSVTCEVAEYVSGNIDIASVVVTVDHADGSSLVLETVRARP